MHTKYHQITLKDTFSDCHQMFQEDTPSFFKLLGDTLNISEFIPANFYHAFIRLSDENGSIRRKASSLPLSCRNSFLSLRIPLNYTSSLTA